MRGLQEAQSSLAELSDEELVSLLVDASVAVAIRRGVSPQQVLRDGINQYGWSEDRWPEIEEGIKRSRTGSLSIR